MLNNESRVFKTAAYGALAKVGKALSSPRRLEILDLLAQRPLPVDAIARGTGQGVANASQHLQVLKRARVVETRRQGTTVEYRLAPGVAGMLVGLHRLAEARSPELSETRARFFARAEAPEIIELAELTARMEAGTAVLLDVRPAQEFAHAHVPGAHNIPLVELAARAEELPRDTLVVATCRGPLCVFAADAVRMLRATGRQAVRFEAGVSEWVADGGAVESGASS